MLTISDGRSDLWQWDTGRTINVPDGCSQVHFSNKVFGRSIDVDVVGGVAIIPDILLQTDKELTAWAFVGTPENGYTKTSKSFKVNRRNKPADYVFTPTDQTTLDEIVERIDRVEESQDPDAIKNAVDEYLENNPIHVKETDPTVPEWAKQPAKPSYTAEEVGALPADTEIPEAYTLPPATADTLGGVKVGSGLRMDGDVLETEVQKEDIDKLSEDKDKLSQIALLMYQLLGAAAYARDVSNVMKQLDNIYDNGGDVPDAPDEPDEPDEPTGEYLEFDVIVGTILQRDESYIKYRSGESSPANATLNPFAFYVTTGMRYVFSLGGASDYKFGVRTFTISDTNLSFDVPDTSQDVVHSVNNTKVTDTGWVTADTTIVEDGTFNLFVVTFKRADGGNITDSDLLTLNEQFTIKVEEAQ